MTGTFGYRQKCIKRRQHLTNKCSVVDRIFVSQTGTLDKKNLPLVYHGNLSME